MSNTKVSVMDSDEAIARRIRGKIVIHACGGGGSKVANYVYENLKDLSDRFASVEVRYIDTSVSDVQKNGKFYKVDTIAHGSTKIDGSGGRRAANVDAKVSGVQAYLNDSKLHKHETGTYHVVMFTSAGGSGSLIGPAVTMSLLEKGIPAIVAMIADVSTINGSVNTLSVFKALDAQYKRLGKTIPILYVSNNDRPGSNGNSSDERPQVYLTAANNKMLNSISMLTLFLSGMNNSIDHQDMINLIDQTIYNDPNSSEKKVAHGLYGLTIADGSVDLTNENMTVARTLTTSDISPDIGKSIFDHKYGIIDEPDLIEAFKSPFPIRAVAIKDFFVPVLENIASLTEFNKKIVEDNSKSKELAGMSTGGSDEDLLGL